MYFHNVVGTGSYTTSTTNMYHKDRFHGPARFSATHCSSAVHDGATHAPEHAGVESCGFSPPAASGASGAGRGVGVVLILPRATVSTSAARLGDPSKSVKSKKGLVLIILAIVFPHTIKI